MKIDLTRKQAITFCKVVHLAFENLLVPENEREAFREAYQVVHEELIRTVMIEEFTAKQGGRKKSEPVTKPGKSVFYSLAEAIKRHGHFYGHVSVIEASREEDRGSCSYEALHNYALLFLLIDVYEHEQVRVTNDRKVVRAEESQGSGDEHFTFASLLRPNLVRIDQYRFRVRYGSRIRLIVTTPVGKKEVWYVFHEDGVEEQSQGIALDINYDKLGSEIDRKKEQS